MYDLVIIGNSLEGRYAAKEAIKLKYRVALVDKPFKAILPHTEKFFIQTLSDFARMKNCFENDFEIALNLPQNFEITPEYNQIFNYTKESINSLDNQYSLSFLASLGVDIVQEKGEFTKSPQLAFITESRKLDADNYLIATESCYSSPNLKNFNNISYLTLNDLFYQNKLYSLGEKIAIFIDNTIGINLAYSLAILGKKVILISPRKNLFTHEDILISNYIKAKLEAKGVDIIVDNNIKEIKEINQQKFIYIDNEQLEIDDIIYIDKSTPNIEGLNLEDIGVKYNNKRIIVDYKLKTTKDKVYAIGNVIGGYNDFNISKYEADIIVKNIKSSLFFSHQVNYSFVPYEFLYYPHCVRLGFREKQARNFYTDIKIIEEFNSYRFIYKLTNKPLDYIKIILTNNNEILGVYIIGDEFTELINIFALAMKKKIKFYDIF